MKNAGENLHQEWREQLIAYIYQECTREEATRFEEHLGLCAECQRDVSEFSAVRNRLQSWQIKEYPHVRVEVKPSFLASLSQATRLLPLWGRVIGAAAAAVLVLAVFNADLRLGGQEGFRLSFSLLPQARPVSDVHATNPQTGAQDRTEILAVVNKLIDESEKQQARELQVKLTELRSQLESDHRVNLVKFSEGLKRDQRVQLEQFRRSIALAPDLTWGNLRDASDSQSR